MSLWSRLRHLFVLRPPPELDRQIYRKRQAADQMLEDIRKRLERVAQQIDEPDSDPPEPGEQHS